MSRRAGLLADALAVLLAACGGGSDTAPDSLLQPDAQQLEGAPCDSCRPGRLQGQVAVGAALAGARLRVQDSRGQVVQGLADAEGRFDLDVAGLSGALLLQATGEAAGQAVQLHSLCRAAEVGTRAVVVTPLTELIAAQVLGGRPAELLRSGQVDFQRIGAEALRQAEQVVEALVRPLLDATGVPAAVDLRLTPFALNHQGLDAALDLLDLAPAETGYLLRHAAMPADQARLLQPGRLAAELALPAPAAGATAALALLPSLQRHLAAWSALFADGLPAASSLRPWLADGFLDGGLGAEAYIAQVLQRDDPASEGGFSLRGARWLAPRLLAVAADGSVQLRLAVQPAGGGPAWTETPWLQPQGDGWRWRGDGAVARVAVHNLAVLGPKPLDLAALQARPGVVCPPVFDLLPSSSIGQRCHLPGGQGGLPAGGVLDLGQPGDDLFGLLGEFRLADPSPAQRLAAYRQHSQLLAAPSQQIDRFLLLALDARRVHPQAVQARVTGPGLPAAGLLLQPPPRQAGRPVSATWGWANDRQGDADWHGVPLGWCGAAADAAEAQACATAWAGLRAGARYRWTLVDAQGASLGAVEATLADAPADAARLWQDQAALFPRFALADLPERQPTLARLLAASDSAADALWLDWPWQAPAAAGQRLLDLQLAWWRAPDDDSDSGGEVLRLQQPLASQAAGRLGVAWPARSGWRGRWLVGQITATDAWGNRYRHVVAPSNPW